jgi:hypothetical protein
MMRLQGWCGKAWLAGCVLVAAGALLSAEAARGEMPGLVRPRTFQSLSAMPEKVFSNYLNFASMEKDLNLSRQSDENHSGTYWALRFAGPERDLMKVCMIESLSNTPQRGWLLGVDDATGKLKLVQPIPDTKGPVWYLRYSGKHNGYDAYVLQTLTDKEGRDFQFLGLDPISGQPRLTPKTDETTQWFVWTVPDLPTAP